MSKLSTWFHTIADFLTGEIKDLPAEGQTAVANIVESLKGAASVMDQALPTLAKAAVDMLLAKVGGGVYIPDINAFIDTLIAELVKRKTDGSSVTIVPKPTV